MLLSDVLRSLLGPRHPVAWPIVAGPLPITDLARPEQLCLSPAPTEGVPGAPLAKSGDEVTVGQPLWRLGGRGVQPSPFAGKVVQATVAPDLRAGRPRPALLVAPVDGPDTPPLTPLDVDTASRDDLIGRFAEAGILTAESTPRLLVEALGGGQTAPKTVVVLAADREPEVSGTAQLLRERTADAAHAARVLADAVGAANVHLAVCEPLIDAATAPCGQHGVNVLPLPARYPETLEPLVAERVGGTGVVVVALETALAALDAVRDGIIQSKKVVTVIGPAGVAVGNWRVPLGTRIGELLAAASLTPGRWDKVVAGGPMRGFAQHSLDGAIDQGVDAITVLTHDNFVEWSHEPCINCGSCIDICPVNLQIQLIGRYAEFGMFEEAEKLDLDQCIECGLCASICVARRPLIQFIRLAKRESAKARVETEKKEAATA